MKNKNQKKFTSEEAEKYLDIAETLRSGVPFFHLLSALTTIAFIVVWISGKSFFQDFVQYSKTLSYISILIPSAIGAFYLEKHLAEMLEGFSFVVVDFKSRRLILLMAAIIVPLLLITGSTSFVGVDEATYQAADKTGMINIEKLNEQLSTNISGINEQRGKSIESIRTRRNEAKKQKLEAFENQLALVPSKNKLKYHLHNSNNWHKKKLHQSNAKDSFNIVQQKSDFIESFDSETEELISEEAGRFSAQEKTASDNNKIVISRSTKRSDRIESSINWLGEFFGIVVCICLFLSVACSLGAAYIEKMIEEAEKQNDPATVPEGIPFEIENDKQGKKKA